MSKISALNSEPHEFPKRNELSAAVAKAQLALVRRAARRMFQ
jgi:hypothetical protein